MVSGAVELALRAGYRHIDCAMIYRNEKEVGEAIAISMKKLNLKREDIFVTSKVFSCSCNLISFECSSGVTSTLPKMCAKRANFQLIS